MLVPNASVRWVGIDSFVVILDYDRTAFFILDAVAADIWKRIVAGEPTDRIVAALTRTYGPIGGRISRDVDRFLEHCSDNRLLIGRSLALDAGVSGREGDRAPIELGRILPRRLSAWACLRRAARELKTHSLAKVYDRYERLPRPIGPAPALPPLIRSFVQGEVFFPLDRAPNDCLPRSLALFEYLLGQGVNATHVIGVEVSPFSAHAWVEVDGAPVLDSVRTTRRFSVIARLAPPDTAVC